MRRSPVSLLALLGSGPALSAAVGCGKKEVPVSTDPAASVPAPAVTGSAAPSVSVAAARPVMRILARGKKLLLAGTNKDGVIASSVNGLRLSNGQFSEDSKLSLGLERGQWSHREAFGIGSTILAFAGSREPASLWTGDENMYGERRDVPDGVARMRAYTGGVWPTRTGGTSRSAAQRYRRRSGVLRGGRRSDSAESTGSSHPAGRAATRSSSRSPGNSPASSGLSRGSRSCSQHEKK